MKKILSLDGGGIRGIIPAMVLAEVEARTGKSVAAMFDLIAGTSTGGILALALAKDNGQGAPQYAAADLVDLYAQRGPEIFPANFFRRVASLADVQYPWEPLEGILREYFGDALLGQALVPVLVSAYDLERRSPFFFKSWTDEQRQVDTRDVLMRVVARSTSAAPTYFRPELASVQGERYALVDGGVFVNNPAISAYAEARRLFPGESYLVVSLGTGTCSRAIHYEDAADWGKIQWARRILDVVFDGVSDAVDYQLEKILGDHYLRLQTRLRVADDPLDDASLANIEKLKIEARDLLDSQSQTVERLCRLLG
jgi:patatin-like phospholipase/acyl hydrolase